MRVGGNRWTPERIRDLRVNKFRESQARFGTRIGAILRRKGTGEQMSRSRISLWENGREEPGMLSQSALAEAERQWRSSMNSSAKGHQTSSHA